MRDERAVSPVIGVILMVAITVILAAVIGTFVLDIGQSAGNDTPRASMSITVDTATNNVTLEHTGGDAIDQESTRIIIENATGSSVTYEPASTSSALTVGNSVEASTNVTHDIDGALSDMTGSGDDLVISTGDQITVTVIDTDSQRQIFKTTVAA